MSDFTDNAVGLIRTTGPKLRRPAGKCAPLVPMLRELINRPDTPLDAEVKDRITAHLDTAAARFTARTTPTAGVTLSDGEGPGGRPPSRRSTRPSTFSR